MMHGVNRSDYAIAAVLATALFITYNANGREIGNSDSQPTKFAARELLLRGTLALNYVVGARPELRDRAAFRLALDGNYRSAYSPVPSVAAAIIIWPFSKSGLIDLRHPLAPSLISALASSIFVSIAVAITFLTARRSLSRGRALMLAVALGTGTGWWTTASQTLWQHETAILGLTLAVFGLCALPDAADGRRDAPVDVRKRRWAQALLIGIGLGLAASSRQQLAPAVLVLAAAAVARGGYACGVVAAAATAAFVVPLWVVNVRWFGSILGAAPMLEALHASVHSTSRSFSLSSGGFSGLLFSPSRGLLIFSPVVAMLAVAVSELPRAHRSSPLLWCTAAAILQFVLYASYTVWWGGHTFGPRYMLDILPLLVPLGIVTMQRIRGTVAASVGVVTLAWSIGVAALGAFTYPHERWNTSPTDVDRDHARLWDWSDNQIARCSKAGLSPQNFVLFPRAPVTAGGR